MNSRLSEIAVAQASGTFPYPESFRVHSLKRELSELQASEILTFVICVAQAKFPSLKRNLPRTCSLWASLKRTPSEPQARNNLTFVIWLAQARCCSLKRDWSWTTILCDFPKCSKPKPKLSKMFIRFIKNCLDGKNYIMKMIKMELCMLMCK